MHPSCLTGCALAIYLQTSSLSVCACRNTQELVLVVVGVLCLEDNSVSVETAHFTEDDGSGWFYSVAEGNGVLYASDRRQNCIRRFRSDAGEQL